MTKEDKTRIANIRDAFTFGNPNEPESTDESFDAVFLMRMLDEAHEALREFNVNKGQDNWWFRVGSAMLHRQKFGPIVWNNIMEAVGKARKALGEA
jgi:hypothetical protein